MKYLVPANADNLQPGQQIVYIPHHIQEKIKDDTGKIPHAKVKPLENYPHGVQMGFVFKVGKGMAGCRYFYSDGSLRTRSNSEVANFSQLFLYQHTNQKLIEGTMLRIQKEMEEFLSN